MLASVRNSAVMFEARVILKKYRAAQKSASERLLVGYCFTASARRGFWQIGVARQRT